MVSHVQCYCSPATEMSLQGGTVPCGPRALAHRSGESPHCRDPSHPGRASETCKFPNMIPNYPCCLFFFFWILYFVLKQMAWSQGDMLIALSRKVCTAHLLAPCGKKEKKKRWGGKGLPPAVDWLIRDHSTYGCWSLTGDLEKCSEGIYSTVTHSPLPRAFLQPPAFMEQWMCAPNCARRRWGREKEIKGSS